MHRWLSTTALAGALLLAVSAPSQAAEPAKAPLHLTWSAPSACPSRDAVLAAVEQVAASRPLRAVTARGEVTRVGADRWSVHLVTEVDGVTGERSIDASSCLALVTATALILAWSAGLGPPVAEAVPPPPPPPPPRRPPHSRSLQPFLRRLHRLHHHHHRRRNLPRPDSACACRPSRRQGAPWTSGPSPAPRSAQT